jgi:hypothetical protein
MLHARAPVPLPASQAASVTVRHEARPAEVQDHWTSSLARGGRGRGSRSKQLRLQPTNHVAYEFSMRDPSPRQRRQAGSSPWDGMGRPLVRGRRDREHCDCEQPRAAAEGRTQRRQQCYPARTAAGGRVAVWLGFSHASTRADLPTAQSTLTQGSDDW